MMKQTQAEIHRDVHPTPEAVFAMFHWSAQYAASGKGSMGFFDSLQPQHQRFCREAIARIRLAQQEHSPSRKRR